MPVTTCTAAGCGQTEGHDDYCLSNSAAGTAYQHTVLPTTPIHTNADVRYRRQHPLLRSVPLPVLPSKKMPALPMVRYKETCCRKPSRQMPVAAFPENGHDTKIIVCSVTCRTAHAHRWEPHMLQGLSSCECVYTLREKSSLSSA